MNNEENKDFGLEKRTFEFARQIRKFIKRLPKIAANFKDGDQLIRLAANFIEFIEALSEKDKLYRAKICKKESKESNLWLNLLDIGEQSDLEEYRSNLAQEAYELTKIFGSIVQKKQLKQA